MKQLVLLAFIAFAASRPEPQDTLTENVDSLPTNLMEELLVRGGRILPIDSFPLHGGKLVEVPMAPPSLGDILEKIIPNFNDKATHPFAIKQRKRERRHKRAMNALENLDRVRTFDELLREAYEKQMMEDSLGISK